MTRLTRYLVSCSFRPRSLAAVHLLDALTKGKPDPGRAVNGVVTRGWVFRDKAAAVNAYGELALAPGVWSVTLDEWAGR